MEAQRQALQQDLTQQQAESQALLQQLQQQQALIQQLLQEQQVPIVPSQAPAVPFALTPAQAITDVINLTKTACIKLHKAVTAPLATLYDSSPQKLASFLEDVKQHATNCGWMAPDGLLRIINNQASFNPQDYNLITHHCMLSLANIHAKALTYIRQQTRTAQNAYCMYEFFCDSRTDGACICIAGKSDLFKVNNREDGPCYLKVLLNKFHVETNATNFHLHESLTLLPSKMTEYKFDIA